LVQQAGQVETKLSEQILTFSKRIAGSGQIEAACICGDLALSLPNPKAILEVLLIIRGFQPKLLNYMKAFDDRSSMVYAVDKWIFERDVAIGFLGEAFAGKMIFPYIPLINAEYLNRQEVKLKKRLILELLENLILDFPELSYELCIKPEYFLYETMLTRARLFPLTVYRLSDFSGKERKEQNVKKALGGYLKALEELEHEGLVYPSNGYIRIAEKFVNSFRRRRIQFVNIAKTAQKAQRSLFLSSLGVFPEILNILSKSRKTSFKPKPSESDLKALGRIEDPQRYLYIPTAHGAVPLANRIDIKEIARNVLSANKDADVIVGRIGGVLNDVYTITVSSNGEKKKAVVKKYRDWSNFKWFPLSLWTVGTRTFAVLGGSRLEREVAINRLLESKRFNVPKILYANPNQHLVFMEYVEGKNVNTIIKRIARSKNPSQVRKDLKMISRVGKRLANVHAQNIALGDTKPENFMIGKHGEIFLMDFEQASRNGDKVWDVAEFLYYAGHDIPPLCDLHRAELIAEVFVSGYLEAGGNTETVRKAASPKYTKVFSVFTLPNIMLAFSSICRNAGS
jgi:tRNA A-37 threonylcarbamoyl transferase component Bud32